MMTFPQRPPARRVESRWLITFADLISLMLTFFVMLYAMSSVKELTWEFLINTLSQQLSPDRGWDSEAKLTDRTTATIAAADGADLDYLHAVIVQKINESTVLDQVLLRRLDDRLVITLPSDLLFASAGVELTVRAKHAIAELGDTLRHIGNRVDVDGHADRRLDDTGIAPVDWRLAIDRALGVADALRTSGYKREIIALGRSEARSSETAASPTQDQSIWRARHVDVVIRETHAKVGEYGS